MALIPSKSHVNTLSTDNFGFGTMVLLVLVLMFGTNVVDRYVHVSFEIPATLYIICIVVYLLYPSKQNYGKNGAQRIIICMRYYIKKVRRFMNL